MVVFNIETILFQDSDNIDINSGSFYALGLTTQFLEGENDKIIY